MSESTPEFVTVSQAAAALGISERTVQRRCKSGKLKARLVTTESGQVWEVEAATLPTGDDRVTTHFEREPITADKLPTGDAISADRVTTGDDSTQTVQLARMQGFMAGQMETAIARAISAANAPLLDEIRLLRAEIEAMKTSADDAPQAPQTVTTDIHARPAAHVAQIGKAREVQPLQRFVARVFGLRIRDLEK
jgi:hypothetical protein